MRTLNQILEGKDEPVADEFTIVMDKIWKAYTTSPIKKEVMAQRKRDQGLIKELTFAMEKEPFLKWLDSLGMKKEIDDSPIRIEFPKEYEVRLYRY